MTTYSTLRTRSQSVRTMYKSTKVTQVNGEDGGIEEFIVITIFDLVAVDAAAASPIILNQSHASVGSFLERNWELIAAVGRLKVDRSSGTGTPYTSTRRMGDVLDQHVARVQECHTTWRPDLATIPRSISI